jgi:hypothetical protein
LYIDLKIWKLIPTYGNLHGHVSKYVHCIRDIDNNKYASKINERRTEHHLLRKSHRTPQHRTKHVMTHNRTT